MGAPSAALAPCSGVISPASTDVSRVPEPWASKLDVILWRDRFWQAKCPFPEGGSTRQFMAYCLSLTPKPEPVKNPGGKKVVDTDL